MQSEFFAFWCRRYLLLLIVSIATLFICYAWTFTRPYGSLIVLYLALVPSRPRMPTYTCTSATVAPCRWHFFFHALRCATLPARSFFCCCKFPSRRLRVGPIEPHLQRRQEEAIRVERDPALPAGHARHQRYCHAGRPQRRRLPLHGIGPKTQFLVRGIRRGCDSRKYRSGERLGLEDRVGRKGGELSSQSLLATR